MAVWQFELTPILASEATSNGVAAIWLSEEEIDSKLLSFAGDAATTLAERLDRILPPAHGWGRVQMWGDEKRDDVQAFITADGLEWPQIRINVASASLPLIEQFCALAGDLGWVFVAESGAVIQPHPNSVLRAIDNSPARRFVDDPQSFIACAAESEQPPDRL
jgi:hypothetical protein